MSGLARIGHIARGVNQGLFDAQQMQANQQRMGLADADAQWQQQSRQRQQQQWERDDAANADLEAARVAGMKALDEDRAAYETQPVQAGGAKAPYQPSAEARLKAMEASSHELLKRGRYDIGQKLWTEAEGIRAGMRTKAAQDLWGAMNSGRDITEAWKRMDRYADDGYEIDDVKPGKAADGQPAYTVRYKNRITKEVSEPTTVTQDQLRQRVMGAVGKPEEFAKNTYATLLENLKADLRRKGEEHETDEYGKRKKLDVKAATEIDAVRTSNDIRVKTTPGASSSGELSANVRLLRERRLSAENEVRGLNNQLKEARSSERPALQRQLNEAQQRVREFGQEIDAYEAERRGGGSPAAAKPLALPKTQDQLRRGQVYETARGPARWNGSAFEAQ